MENKKVNKEVKLNINYLRFIKELKDSKIEVDSKNKEKIVELYNEIVELRFNNIKRVDSRVKRVDLDSLRVSKLKEMGVSEIEFKKISKNLRDLSRDKVSEYVSILK